jgi:hypothetical protein
MIFSRKNLILFLTCLPLCVTVSTDLTSAHAGTISLSTLDSDPRLKANAFETTGVPISNNAEIHSVLGLPGYPGFGLVGNMEFEEALKFADLLSDKVYYIDAHQQMTGVLNISPIPGRLQSNGPKVRNGSVSIDYDASFLAGRGDIECVFLGACGGNEDFAYSLARSSGKRVLTVEGMFEPSNFAVYQKRDRGGEIISIPEDRPVFHLWEYDAGTDRVSIVDSMNRSAAMGYLGIPDGSIPSPDPNTISIETTKGRSVFRNWNKYNQQLAKMGRAGEIIKGNLPRGPFSIRNTSRALSRAGKAVAISAFAAAAGPAGDAIDIAGAVSDSIQKGCRPVASHFYSPEQAACADNIGRALVSSGWQPRRCLTPHCNEVHPSISPELFGRYLWSNFLDDVPGVNVMSFDAQSQYFSQYVFELGQRLHSER